MDAARPKAPKAYQTESTQALSDEAVRALLKVVKERADSGSLVSKRDYALLLFYFTTGMRRREVMQLTWGEIKLGQVITLTTTVKGGEYLNREVSDPSLKAALLDYLETSGRLQQWKQTPLCGPLTTAPANTPVSR